MSLSFVQLNIESERHLHELETIFRASPDIIHLQEIFRVHAEDLAARYGYYLSYSPHCILNDPAGKFAPLGEWGIAIFTKAPHQLLEESYYKLNKEDVVPILYPGLSHPLSVLIVQMGEYTLATTHFTWAMPDLADQVQAKDLASLMQVLDKYPDLILSGDFNAPRGGLVQTTLANKYNYHIPDSVTSTLDKKLFRIRDLELVIDHLFASPEYMVSNVLVKDGYSDHRAIFAEVTRVTT